MCMIQKMTRCSMSVSKYLQNRFRHSRERAFPSFYEMGYQRPTHPRPTVGFDRPDKNWSVLVSPWLFPDVAHCSASPRYLLSSLEVSGDSSPCEVRILRFHKLCLTVTATAERVAAASLNLEIFLIEGLNFTNEARWRSRAKGHLCSMRKARTNREERTISFL